MDVIRQRGIEIIIHFVKAPIDPQRPLLSNGRKSAPGPPASRASRVALGEEIPISRGGEPIARLVPDELFLSAASTREMAIKYAIGKLPPPDPPREYVPDRMLASGVTRLPVEHRHSMLVADLPPHHRDPFDRLLVAQATVESMPLLTADLQLGLYDVETIKA